MPRFSEAAQARALTGALCAAYLLYLFSTGYQQQYGDANTYWELTGRYFHEQRRFRLLGFDNSLRGYLWPLLLLPLRVASYLSGVAPIQFGRVLGAGVAAVLFGGLGPALWQAIRPGPLSWGRRLLFAGLGFAFWRDYFHFTLADFPALLALLTALWLTLTRFERPFWALAAGGLLMAAVNLRPIYASSAAVLLGGLLAVYGRGGGPGRWWPVLACAAGMALVAGPQLAINWCNFGRVTPLVLARKDPRSAQSLYLSQITWGLAAQKYETTFDPVYPDPRVMFTDPVGQRIMDQEGISYVHGPRGWAHFLAGIGRHAPAVAGLYARHLFNGFDLKYPTPYIPRVFGPTLPLSVLNYTVLFGAGLVLYWNRRTPLRFRQRLVLAALLVPVLLAVPTVVECRFFLPAHLLVYALVAFAWPPDGWRRVRCWPVLLAYAGFGLLCLLLSANTLAHMTHGPRPLWP